MRRENLTRYRGTTAVESEVSGVVVLHWALILGGDFRGRCLHTACTSLYVVLSLLRLTLALWSLPTRIL